ncbi:MAG: methylamine utilization protein [Candidatus Tectimicrobiota bacterium]|nr:MAG: methylamine utilization protein [Candidatus Tectomicrobia bacterium]
MGRLNRVSMGLAALMLVAVAVPPAGSYQAVAVTEGGTISGKVVFVGTPPPLRTVIPTKDKEVCGGPRQEPRIVLGADRGVQEAIVYLKAVTRGKPWAQQAGVLVIDNVKCRFEPTVQVVPVGAKLTIRNSDPVLHNTHGYLRFNSQRRTVFNVALPTQGLEIERVLRRPGIIDVECDAHGWMQAWILVAENPYYAITTADGSFTLTDVPPGTYTLVAFHHYTGAVEVPVTVTPNATTRVTVELKK